MANSRIQNGSVVAAIFALFVVSANPIGFNPVGNWTGDSRKLFKLEPFSAEVFEQGNSDADDELIEARCCRPNIRD